MKRILCSLLVTAVPFGAAFAQTAPQPIVAPSCRRISLTCPEGRC